jgi:hypothetical protein
MYKRALFASITSVCLLTNCTPYAEVDRNETSSAAAQSETSGNVSTPMTSAEADGTAAPGPKGNPDFQASQADGGAGQVDAAIAATYKIRTRSDIEPAVDAMMALADKDGSGQLTREEFGILAPALALADHTDGGTVARQGATEQMEETASGEPINADEFFNETAGSYGTISRAELTQAITARFNAADADGNGELSQEEARDFAASMRFSQ